MNFFTTKQKALANARARVRRRVSTMPLQRLDVRRLLALRAGLNVERDTLVLFQRLEPLGADFGEVSEQIVATCVGGDKTKALSIVEPFDDTGFHIHFLEFVLRRQINTPHRTRLGIGLAFIRANAVNRQAVVYQRPYYGSTNACRIRAFLLNRGINDIAVFTAPGAKQGNYADM
jgi:hypothetical protein